VATFSVAFFAVLAMFAHAYLAPFGTVTGQVVLAVVGCLDAAGLWLLARMVRGQPEPRLLGDTAKVLQ
jgi:tight adherence protein B